MIQLFSPAKINLFLRIVSKRADGYHNLSSLFQTISLGDTLTVQFHDRDELTSSDPSLPTDSTNLILKATELFRCKTQLNLHFKIDLIKRIPTQAGLGGGSSNAATMLWACNLLANTNINIHLLQAWSAEIGSDIPFFFSQGTAHCTGRGENVHSLPPLPPQTVWIVKPQGGLSTPEVYRKLNFTSPFPEEEINHDLASFFSESKHCFNDLEKPAFAIRPELEQLKMNLKECGFETVLLSGSGSSFFCLGEATPPFPDNVAVFCAQFINRPPSDWYKNSDSQNSIAEK